MEQLGKEKVVVPVVGKSSFVGLMTSTRRPVENYTPRPKPSVEALRTAKEESEGAYTEARSKKNALALKHNKLTREILEARERIAAAASAQQTLIELAAVDQAKPDDLLRVKKAVEDARAAEADLRVLHDGTGKAL
ncbi:MAG: hypothetical protein Q8P48_08420, partial [Deltaproteobacteria bacterium]|nr:hypothetical protein [Deltaproteobacteria bacterium]